MNLKTIIALFAFSLGAQAQGFLNLGFESASLTPVPAGQFGGPVPISEALPYWIGYLGGDQVTQVLQNNFTLGNASIDILGPDWSFGGIIEGQYTVVLQPGLDPFGSGQNVSASISQTGVVPGNAESLDFKASASSGFSISLGGQNLSVVPMGTGANYTLYGVAIPPLDAGEPETLTISATAGPNSADYFDSFVFSATNISPEQSPLILTGIGGLIFALRRRFRQR
jgi:hypothetical protein